MNAIANVTSQPLDPELLRNLDAYWRAANYLSVGQIYLWDNPLLKKPLAPAHIKPRLLGHWGTTPGLNFIYVHLSRIINKYDLNVINITGPGHGGPGLVANAYLEGTYSEIYPNIAQDENGMKRLFKQFSFPGGIPSHVSPETPGSIHEGGELGYSLSHAFGAAFDNPDLLVACVVGDGEAETGALATSWHSNKFLNPVHDGAVLPILHLNGYKIAGPTVLARIPRALPSDFSGDLKRATLDRFRTDLKEVSGAAQFIRRFSHLPRCIASSSSIDRLQLCLEVLALEAEFGDHVYSADMVARGKPHPDIFLFAAERLGVSPEQCLVIEDSAGGIKAAVAAGMTAVGLCAASHIRDGHDTKLRDAGAVHLAPSWAEVERFALEFLAMPR